MGINRRKYTGGWGGDAGVKTFSQKKELTVK